MDKLNITDIPALVKDGVELPGILAVVALAIALVSTGFLFWSMIRLYNQKARARVATLVATLSITVVLLGLSVVASNQQQALYFDNLNEYREASAKIVDQNSETTAAWINSNYEVEVDQEDAAQLLGTVGRYVQTEENRQHPYKQGWENNGITYSDLETDKIQSIAEPAYVKSDAGEVLNVQIVWDGDSYVLLREGGGEVAQRTS